MWQVCQRARQLVILSVVWDRYKHQVMISMEILSLKTYGWAEWFYHCSNHLHMSSALFSWEKTQLIASPLKRSGANSVSVSPQALVGITHKRMYYTRCSIYNHGCSTLKCCYVSKYGKLAFLFPDVLRKVRTLLVLFYYRSPFRMEFSRPDDIFCDAAWPSYSLL